MTSVSLSDDGEEMLEKVKETFDLAPSNRKIVEAALDEYHETRTQNNE